MHTGERVKQQTDKIKNKIEPHKLLAKVRRLL